MAETLRELVVALSPELKRSKARPRRLRMQGGERCHHPGSSRDISRKKRPAARSLFGNTPPASLPGCGARPEGFSSGRAGAQRSTERWARIFSASALKAS